MDKKFTEQSDDKFERRAKRLFDESVEGLDARTRSRLNQSRQRALAALTPRRSHTRFARWVPAAGAVAATAMVVMLWNDRPLDDVAVPTSTAGDFELLMDETSLEMLEDLEFYSWIDMEGLEAVRSDENVGEA